jgi:hypothetical protein
VVATNRIRLKVVLRALLSPTISEVPDSPVHESLRRGKKLYIEALGAQKTLHKGDLETAYWQNALTDASGSNGQILISILPELKLIIGKQPPLPELRRVFPEAIELLLNERASARRVRGRDTNLHGGA